MILSANIVRYLFFQNSKTTVATFPLYISLNHQQNVRPNRSIILDYVIRNFLLGWTKSLKPNYLQKICVDLIILYLFETNSISKTGVINDPLGQTHSLVGSEHCFQFVLLFRCRKVGTARVTKFAFENSVFGKVK